MYFEIAVAAIILGTYAYHRWIEDHPSPRPVAVNVPRVDEGAPVPLIYGKCRVRAPILVWAGGQRTPKIRGERFAYFLDMVYVVGIPFFGGEAELLGIYAGDQFLELRLGGSYPFDIPGANFPVFVPNIPRWFKNDFNPDVFPTEFPAADRRNYWVQNLPWTISLRQEGDEGPHSGSYDQSSVFDGFVEFHTGTPTQIISDDAPEADIDSVTDTEAAMRVRPFNDGMYTYQDGPDPSDIAIYSDLPENIIPSNIPSYRNQALACLYKWCNGDSPSIKGYGFEVQSLSTGTSAYLGQSLTDDADPAAVLIDLMTSPWGKLALPISKIDIPSFQAASLTLFNEGHGYSQAIEAMTEASTVIGDIMRQIDGVYYEEPTTGKIVLKLVRNDYNPLALLDVNPDNADPADGSWISVQGQAETINQVRVTFTDRENDYADGLSIGQDPANVIAQGGKLRSVDLRFPGCCTRALAEKIASRELAAVSRPIVKASVIALRTFYLTRPGDVVTFTWPQLGIDKMVMRVARVDLGTLQDGAIRLDLIRDIFDVSNGAFPVAA